MAPWVGRVDGNLPRATRLHQVGRVTGQMVARGDSYDVGCLAVCDRTWVSRPGLGRMAMPIPGVHGIVWTSPVDWAVEGQQPWGEDQDAWRIQGWSSFRWAAREGRS